MTGPQSTGYRSAGPPLLDVPDLVSQCGQRQSLQPAPHDLVTGRPVASAILVPPEYGQQQDGLLQRAGPGQLHTAGIALQKKRSSNSVKKTSESNSGTVRPNSVSTIRRQAMTQ